MLDKNRHSVIQTLGTPVTELNALDCTILIYSRGPLGKHTFFVYVNRDDRVERWTQVLDEKNFNKISPGMHRDEVIANIGEAKDKFGLGRDRGTAWDYRYVKSHCIWLQIEFTRADIIRSSGYSKPPKCRIRGRAS